MASPLALVLTGHGLNCEAETAEAMVVAGARARIVHVDDVGETALADAQILIIPGGFSFGDDTGAGNALAQRLRLRWMEPLTRFLDRQTLVLGLCNGCQVLAALGLIGGGRQAVTLLPNAGGRYQDRWVEVIAGEAATRSPWLTGIRRLKLPVAHGEGQVFFGAAGLAAAHDAGLVALRYANPLTGTAAGGVFPANPNGSVDDIAGLCDATGRVLGMMPHPERALWFHHRPDWPLVADQARRRGEPLPEHGDGTHVFRNAVAWFA